MELSKLRQDETFSCAYDCTPLSEIPTSSARCIGFPDAIDGVCVNGPILKIEPHNENCAKWIGTFAWGGLSPKAATGVFSHPSPTKLLVVAKGDAYIVDVENPTGQEPISVLPVMGVVAIKDAGIVVLYDYTRVDAYDENGRRWRTPSLSWDGIRDVAYDGEHVVGMGWDPAKDKWVPFAINPCDGSYTGGASPESRGY